MSLKNRKKSHKKTAHDNHELFFFCITEIEVNNFTNYQIIM